MEDMLNPFHIMKFGVEIVSNPRSSNSRLHYDIVALPPRI